MQQSNLLCNYYKALSEVEKTRNRADNKNDIVSLIPPAVRMIEEARRQSCV